MLLFLVPISAPSHPSHTRLIPQPTHSVYKIYSIKLILLTDSASGSPPFKSCKFHICEQIGLLSPRPKKIHVKLVLGTFLIFLKSIQMSNLLIPKNFLMKECVFPFLDICWCTFASRILKNLTAIWENAQSIK